MPSSVHIAGARVVDAPAAAVPMDSLIADAVGCALSASGLHLNALDGVVALGNDADDGMLSTLLRAEAAGAVGREYLYMTGGFCQAVAAAASFAAAGLQERIAVVGWGSGGAATDQNETMIADPFFLRPVGATPENLRRLRDRALGWPDEATGTASVGPRKDMAVCLIVANAADMEGAIELADWRSTFRAYLPAFDDLDPARWRAEILPDGVAAADLFISPDAGNEHAGSRWMRGAADLVDCLSRLQCEEGARSIWFVEGAGPLGQSMTALGLAKTA